MRAQKKSVKQELEEISLELHDPADWESVLVEAIRYRSCLRVSFNDQDIRMEARIANYSLMRPRAGEETPRLRLGVYWDSDEPAHEEFMRSTWLHSSQNLSFRLHLPQRVIAFKGEWVELNKNKIVFEVHAPLFQVRNRRQPRLSVKFSVAHPSDEPTESLWLQGDAFDVSEQGMGLILKERAFRAFPRLSSRVDGLTFRMGGRVFRVSGVVRHASLIQQNQFPQKRFRVGIEFDDLDLRDQEALKALLRRRDE